MTAAPAAPATSVGDALRTLVVVVLVSAIVVFDPRDGHPGGRPKYLVVVGGAVAAGALLTAGRRSLRSNPLRWPLAALLACAALATIASEHPRTAVYGFPGSYDGLLTTLSYALVFVASAGAFRRAGSVMEAVRVLWFGAGTAVLVFGLAQLADRLVSPDTGWDWARPGIAPWTIGSTLGNPNHLGALVAMLLPLAAVLIAVTRGRERRLVVGGAAVALVELGITASRGAWAAVVVVSAFAAFVFRRRLHPYRRRLAAVATGSAVALALLLLVLGSAGVTKLAPEALARTGSGTTLDLRLEVWSAALRVSADHPILGVGPDVFPVVFPAYASERFSLVFGPFTIANGAHNVFLNTLANLGVGGLASFLALLATTAAFLKGTWGRLDGGARLLASGLTASVVAYLIQACLNTQTVALSLCFWVLLGWLVAIGSAAAKEE